MLRRPVDALQGQEHCRYHEFPGWWCSRKRGHIGPCVLRPRWWNLMGHLR